MLFQDNYWFFLFRQTAVDFTMPYMNTGFVLERLCFQIMTLMMLMMTTIVMMIVTMLMIPQEWASSSRRTSLLQTIFSPSSRWPLIVNHFCHKLVNSSQIDSLSLSRSRWTCGSTWPPPTWASRSLCSCSQGSKMPQCFQQSTALVLSFKQANNQSNLQTDPVCVKGENVVFKIA